MKKTVDKTKIALVAVGAIFTAGWIAFLYLVVQALLKYIGS